MRTFISIDLPEEARRELIKVQEQLKSENIRATFVKPEVFHFSLKFFGELTDIQVNKAKEALKSVKFEPFKVKLNSLGIFPSQEFIRVIWADIFPKEQLIKLQQQIDAALEKGGFKKEKSFETHITLARVKFIKDKKTLMENLKKIKIKQVEFEIKNFSLKKSTLTGQGPVYEDISAF